MSSRERFEAWYWQEISANQDFMPVCWEARQARDAEVERLVKLLAECGRTLEMWADVAPAISLRADIDALLREYTPKENRDE